MAAGALLLLLCVLVPIVLLWQWRARWRKELTSADAPCGTSELTVLAIADVC